jgi:predicted dehydrogenase
MPGEPVESRAVVTRDVHRGPHDETCVLSMRFANGTTAEIISSVLFEAPPRLEVFGSKGWAVGDETLGTHGGGQIWLGHNKLPFEKVDPYAGEIADFVQAIREGRDPEVNGEEGLRNVELLLRAIGDEA